MREGLISNETTKQIFIIGEINEETNKAVVCDLLSTNWNDPDRKYQELLIYISSSGGNLRDCFSIIDTVQLLKKAYKLKITTVVLGEASSAGFFLFLLGDRRIVLPNGRMFVHEHMTFSDGQTYSELKKEQVDHDMIYDSYIKYTSERLGLNISKVKKLIGKNSWLTQEEMISWQIIKN